MPRVLINIASKPSEMDAMRYGRAAPQHPREIRPSRTQDPRVEPWPAWKRAKLVKLIVVCMYGCRWACAWELILAWDTATWLARPSALLFVLSSVAHLLSQWTSSSRHPSHNLDVEVLTLAVFLSHLVVKVWVRVGWDGMSPRLTLQRNDFCTSLHFFTPFATIP